MHGKKYRAALEKIDRLKTYSVAEAVALAKETSATKFDGSVEIHIRLGIDPTKAEQIVRATANLPHGTGKKLKIAVFAKGAVAKAAKEAGAALVGDDELIAEIKKTSKTDFDIALATPDMMKSLAPIAKTLGTKGLMPNPKNETVTADPAAMVASLQGGKVSFRSDTTGNLHQIVGKVSFSAEQLIANVETFIDAVKRAKPADTKGTYIRSITISTSMGPGIKIQA